jgi:1-acyl-sn-glycerol-3-phosphate acyltransferase
MSTPRVSPLLVRLFTRYSRGYVARHFHAVRVLKSHSTGSASAAVVFLNHASWWDPLICLLLAAQFFPGRRSFAPIDERALRRYGLLSRLGFFPVANGTARGAAQFMRAATAVLDEPANLLWLTPQGQFTDVRARPITFQRGLTHLATRNSEAMFLPLAIEYTFWEERLPEVLIAFGPAVHQPHERALEEAQEALAAASQRREADEWQLLLRGGAGTSPIYDTWRRVRAALRGDKFQKEHGAL